MKESKTPTSFTWFVATVTNVFQILLNLPHRVFLIHFGKLLTTLSHATEAGLSNYHKLITCMKVTISHLKPKVINYCNYKKFDEQNFLSDIQQEHFKCKSSDVNEN